MSSVFWLSIFALVISLICIAGGIWALLASKIVVDQNGNVVTSEIEISWLGKLKTGAPSVVVIFIGSALCVFTLNKQVFTLEKFPLQASIDLDGFEPAGSVFIGAIPQRYLKSLNHKVGSEALVNIDVDHPDIYSVVAFAISSLSEEGRTDYRVVHGPVQMDDEQKFLRFDGVLR